MLYMKGGLSPYNQSLLQIVFFVAYQKYSSDSLHLRVPSNSLTILGTDVGMGIYILHASRFVGFYCLKLRNKVDM